MRITIRCAPMFVKEWDIVRLKENPGIPCIVVEEWLTGCKLQSPYSLGNYDIAQAEAMFDSVTHPPDKVLQLPIFACQQDSPAISAMRRSTILLWEYIHTQMENFVKQQVGQTISDFAGEHGLV